MIPPNWHFGDGKGPEECRRRLEAEGVTFEGGRADPARRVGYEEVRARLRLAGVPVPADPEA